MFLIQFAPTELPISNKPKPKPSSALLRLTQCECECELLSLSRVTLTTNGKVMMGATSEPEIGSHIILSIHKESDSENSDPNFGEGQREGEEERGEYSKGISAFPLSSSLTGREEKEKASGVSLSSSRANGKCIEAHLMYMSLAEVFRS